MRTPCHYRKNPPAAWRLLACAVFFAAATTQTTAEVDTSRNGAPYATLIVVRPPVAFGGKKAAVTVDGRARGAKSGRLTLSVGIAGGTYQVYGITSNKPKVSFTFKQGETVYVVRRGERGSERIYDDLIAGRPPRAGSVSERRQAPDTAQKAILNLLCPGVVFGKKPTVTADGRARKARLGLHVTGVEISPGVYELRSGRSAKAVAAVTIRPGELLYVISEGDARSQRMLGDIMFENRASAAALARYRRSLALAPDQHDLYRRYADLAIESGRRKEAIAALERVVSSGQADGQTYQALGDLLLKDKRPGEARTMYEKALAAAGDNATVLVGLAMARRKAGDLRGAALASQKVIDLAPDSLRCRKALGEVLLLIGDTSRAVETYEEFLQRGGADNTAALAVGAYHFRHGRSEDAVRYLAMVKGTPAVQFDCLYMLGASYSSLGQYAKAADRLGIAAVKYAKHPRWPAATQLLIECYLALKDDAKADLWVRRYAQSVKRGNADIAFYRAYLAERKSAAVARSLYEKNVTTYPFDHRNYLRLGLLSAQDPAGLAQSVSMLRKAVALADTIPEAWLELARVYRRLSRSDEELAALSVFLAAQPQHPEANARMGELMLAKGRTDEAMARLEAARTAGGDNPEMLAALAKGYLRSGRQAEAVEALERAKRIAPDNLEIRQRLVELYQTAGTQDKVLAELKEMLALRRDNTMLLTYAKLAFAAGQFAEAADAIENIRATDPQNIEALMLLGRVLRAQEKYDEAVDVYKEVSYNAPSFVPGLFERAETHRENSQPHWAEAFYRRVLKEEPKHARAVFGLAMVAKMRMQYGLYREHLHRAAALAPDDPVIRRELEQSMQGRH